MKLGLGIYQGAKFSVPENPITRAISTGTAVVGAGCVGLGCSSCGGKCGSAPKGMGDLNDITSNLTSLNLGAVLSGNDFVSWLPNWGVVLGGLFVFSLFSRSADYREEKRELRRKYPRGAVRALRAGRAAYKAAA